MIETELRKMIENMVNEMVQKEGADTPHITKNLNTEPLPEGKNNNIDDKCLGDITEIDLKKLLLVDNPKNKDEYLSMKSRTPLMLTKPKGLL